MSGLPVTRRVMNLSHFLTRNARRLPTHPGLIWGEQTWTWAEMEARVTAMAAALAARGDHQGGSHSRAFEELQRDVQIHVRHLPAGRCLGPDQFPPAAR